MFGNGCNGYKEEEEERGFNRRGRRGRREGEGREALGFMIRFVVRGSVFPNS